MVKLAQATSVNVEHALVDDFIILPSDLAPPTCIIALPPRQIKDSTGSPMRARSADLTS